MEGGEVVGVVVAAVGKLGKVDESDRRRRTTKLPFPKTRQGAISECSTSVAQGQVP